MKIALMTWFHYDNYGTALQVTALADEISIMGHEVSIINYIPNGALIKLPEENMLKYSLKRIKNKIYRILNSCSYSHKVFTSIEREQLFNNFLNDNLIFTDECKTLSDLERLNKEFDAFICGSDQIWAPSCFDSHYFLDFVKDTNKMIAYAPSVGLNYINNPEIASKMAELISRFNHLSVRESQGAKLINKISGKNAEIVLDPTLLKNEEFWINKAKLSTITLKEKYLLVYFLGYDKKYWKTVKKIARKKSLKLCVIPVFDNDLEREGCLKQPIGPSEFLYLIKNAEYVCTDSFHGVSFSIIFNRNFCVFERFKKNEKNNQNSRIYNILNIVALNNRLLKHSNKRSLMEDINFSFVKNKLKSEQEKSRTYLLDSLYNVEYSLVNDKKKHIFRFNTLCCGCGACKVMCPTDAIEIKMNSKGFYSAFVNEEKCVSCGKCISKCPMQSDFNKNMINEGDLYSYKDHSQNILMQSSSGGFAYRISKVLLEQGYSIAGCTFNESEQKAKHILIYPQESDKLTLLQGSKYMQSEFASIVPELIKCPTPIAVFGTPCQISGIKKVLKNRNDVIYIDLICHGIPSYFVYIKYMEYLKTQYHLNIDNPKVIFRYKSKGWRDKHIYIADRQQSICIKENDDYYFQMFEKGHCYMDSCYDCRWRDCSEADIRIGDYWGEKFVNDSTGVSMILAMSEIGKSLMKKIEKYDFCTVKKEPIYDYYVQQTSNYTKPIFYNDLFSDLSNEHIALENIIKKYVIPFEMKNRFYKQLIQIKNAVKKRSK